MTTKCSSEFRDGTDRRMWVCSYVRVLTASVPLINKLRTAGEDENCVRVSRAKELAIKWTDGLTKEMVVQ